MEKFEALAEKVAELGKPFSISFNKYELFHKNMRVNIDLLQPTEIALPRGSIGWIDRKYKSSGIGWFEKIMVTPWNGRYAIIKGNKRTYIFYLNGVRELEVVCEELDPRSLRYRCAVDGAQAAQESGIIHIRDLESRIYNRNKYERLAEESVAGRAFR
jgi:hypothetical protein